MVKNPLVHTESSEEYYHDYRFPGKFANLRGLVKVYDSNGDQIYQLED